MAYKKDWRIMSTSFSTKIAILAEVHAEAVWNSELDDIALPLAYLVENKLATLLPTADNYIHSTWEMLCKLLEVDPDAEYEDSDDMIEESTKNLNKIEEGKGS
jgi:hypothetical protein